MEWSKQGHRTNKRTIVNLLHWQDLGRWYLPRKSHTTIVLMDMRCRQYCLLCKLKPPTRMNFSGFSLRTTIVVQATVNDKCCLLVMTWRNTVKRKMQDPEETHQIGRYQIRCSWISLGTAKVTRSRLHSGLKVIQLLYIIVQPIKSIGSGVMEFFCTNQFHLRQDLHRFFRKS